MKKEYLVVACGIMLLICILQQWRIQTAVVPSLDSLPVPAATWDVNLLSQSIDPPPGAKSDSPTRDSTRLKGTTHQDRGFEACLWLDTKDVSFTGRASSLREERITAIAAHYANKIAAAIPSAVVTAGIESESMAESGALHSVYLVEHPHGHIAVSAGYRRTKDGTLSDSVKINVLSRNYSKGPGAIMGPAVGRFAEPEG